MNEALMHDKHHHHLFLALLMPYYQLFPNRQGLLEQELAWRTRSLQRVACLPPLTPSAVDVLLGAAATSLPRFLESRGLRVEQNGTSLASQLSSTVEPAIQGTELHALRAAVMALTGWAAEALARGESECAPEPSSSQGETVATSRSSSMPRHLLPERSSIRCTLCGAAVGLWSFFPQLTTYGTQHASGPSPKVGGANLGVSSPRVSSPGTTIAGGCLGVQRNRGPFSDTNKTSGPFGLPTAKPLFGSPIQQSPTVNPEPTATSPAHTIAGGDFGAAVTDKGSGHSAAFGADRPAPFGFASLAEQMQERGMSSGGTLQRQGGKRKRNDCADKSANLPSALSAEERPANQQVKESAGLPLFLDGSAGCYLSKAALQRYATLEPKQLNCLELHRSFCPWIAAGTQAGWEVLLERLEEAEMSALGSERTPGKRGAAKDWNPLALLNSVLGKVDVKL